MVNQDQDDLPPPTIVIRATTEDVLNDQSSQSPPPSPSQVSTNSWVESRSRTRTRTRTSSQASPFVETSFTQQYDPNVSYSASHSSQAREPTNRRGSNSWVFSRISRNEARTPNLAAVESVKNDDDFKDFEEGLGFALGSSDKAPKWFPVNHDKPSDTHLSTNDPPDRSASRSPYDLGGDIPRVHTHTSTRSFDEHSLHTILPSSSTTPYPSHQVDENVFADPSSLEAGRLSVKTSRQQEDTLSPNFLTKISNRIAGTGSEANPDAASKRHSTISSDKSEANDNFLTPISRPYPDDNRTISNENLLHPGSSSVSGPANASVVSSFPAGVPSEGLGLYSQGDQPSNSEVDDDGETHYTTDSRRPSFRPSRRSSKISSHSTVYQGNKASRHLFGNSLNIFSPQSKLRQICFRVASHPSLNFILLVLLSLQTALLAYRQWNPDALHGYVSEGYNWADYALMLINILYTIEVIAKIIAYGFVNDHIMFETLNLPYPESQFNLFHYNPFNIQKLFHVWGIYRQGNKKFNNNLYDYYHKANVSSSDQESSGGDENVEISLSDNDIPNSTLERSNHHLNYNNSLHDGIYSHATGEEQIRENIELKNVPVNISQRLKTKNTLLLPESYSSIDQSILKRAYARNSWHRIDFVSTVCFWISLVLSINHYDAEHRILIFRTLSCLRILRLCNLTNGTSTILSSCKAAIPKLIDISFFIGFFWLAFGIIGVQSFKESLSRHCVWTNPDDPTDTYVNIMSFCGSYTGLDGTAQPYLYSDGTPSLSIKGYRCPMYSQCISGENPYGGTVNFDNILQSLEMVFVIMSANTFTDIMYYTMDTDTMASCLFFIAAIFILTVWLMNVFIAAIVTSFHRNREQTEERAGGIWKYLFPPADASTFNERIDKAKEQNVFLKYYYNFDFIFVLLIFADLLVQCLRNYNMTDLEKHALYRIEAAFTCTFLAEIVVRFLFHMPNFRLFFASRRNVFDLFLATITSIIILNPVKEKLGHAYYWLTVFQLMRFYRVVLFSKITRNLWIKIMRNFRAIYDLTLFYFIFLSLVSILMARYFEGVIPVDEIDNVDFALNTLPNTFIALYVITSTENWTEILYPLQEYGYSPIERAFGTMFLIAWFILSNSVILSIFIAVIADALEVSEEIKREKQLHQFIFNMVSNLQTSKEEGSLLSKLKKKFFKTKTKRDVFERAIMNFLLSGREIDNFLVDNQIDVKDSRGEESIRELPSSSLKRWFLVNYHSYKTMFSNPFYLKNDMKVSLHNFEPSDFANAIMIERRELLSKQNRFLEENPRYNNVFYVITPQHRLRRFCQRMVSSSYGDRIDGVEPYKRSSEIFSIIMFLATIALVITACYLTPLYRKRQVELYGNYNWAFWLEVAFNVLFTSEFLIKIFADGLIFTPNAYMRTAWNLIDLMVLVSLWIELIAFLKDDGNLARFIRGLKALRALRLLTISDTAKSTFHNTLISGFGKIINAAVISLCLLFPFSIWGLNIFEGRLGYCIDGSSQLKDCYNEYNATYLNWDIVSPNVYTNPLLQFDDFGTSFVSLFEIISLEGWVDLLSNLMNSTGVGTVPEPFASPINGVFLVFFNLISTIFILTLFISVIINNYGRTTGRAYLTGDQKLWYQVKKILLQVKPSKRKPVEKMTSFRRFCYRMTVEKNKYWMLLLNLILFIHVIALLLEFYPTPNGLDYMRSVAYMVVSMIFFIHFIMLCIAQGLRIFLGNNWNLFSTVVCIGAVISTFIGFFLSDGSVFVNINKLFLVGILTFVIPRSDRLNQLLRFASAALPAFISLAFTWIVVFLVFAIALNQIFGLTKIGPNGTGNINLRSVPKALIMLFKCSFGEGWNYVMDDYGLSPPFCTSSGSIDESDCGNKQFAYFLFISWNILSMYIFVNMFVSLILDSFSYVNYKSGYGNLIDRDEIRKFKRSWQKFDPQGTGYIKPIDLPKLLHTLDGALSFHLYSGSLEIPVLCKRWFIRNDINDPYDVTPRYDAIQKTLDRMDIPKIRERRQQYERFIEEALYTMELNEDPGISFSRILLQLPFYISFEAGKCLNLIDFLERTLLEKRVTKQLHIKKVYETMAAFACRWKYQKNKRLGIRDPNIDVGSNFIRNSYLSNENYKPDKDPEGSLHEYEDEEYADDESFKTGDEEFLGAGHEEGDTSHGSYIPKSPISAYKATRLRDERNSIYIEIPHTSGIDSPPSRRGSRSRSASRSPFHDPVHLTPNFGAEDEGAHTPTRRMSYIPLSDVGEIIGNSSWGDALNTIRSRDSHSPKRK
ncbi:Ion transport protein-domain-containing protein [Scheffersomyces coipomensis]|uniref:Ion transport protein-domain-containing protein n=1 Tax=Scheffersomyces coipomensis TaxID=1788519 RepID=UPI00315CCF22